MVDDNTSIISESSQNLCKFKFASRSKKNFNLEAKNNSKPNQDSVLNLNKI